MRIAESVILTLMVTTCGRRRRLRPERSLARRARAPPPRHAASARRRNFTARSVATACGRSSARTRPLARRGGRSSALARRLRLADDGAATWQLPNGGSRGHARRGRVERSTPATSAGSSARWRFRLTAAPTLLGHLRVDPGRRRRHRLRAGPAAATSSRSTARHGSAALDAPLPRPERRAERARRRRRARLRRHRLRRVRARRRAPAEELWRRHLTSAREQFVDVAPVSGRGSSSSARSATRRSAAARSTRSTRRPAPCAGSSCTIEKPWRHPLEAGGGGLWYPVSVDARRAALRGQLEPDALGRHARAAERRRVPRPGPLHRLAARARRPHGPAALARPGHAARRPRLRLRGDADPRDGRRRRPRLRRGQGRAGDRVGPRDARRRRWTAVVGLHRNDVGPLPRRRVTVCPGLLGGVETPMAYADGRLFVPVVDLCGLGQRDHPAGADDRRPVARARADSSRSTRRPGRVLWERRLPSPAFGCATVVERRRLHVDVRRVRLRVRRRRRDARLARADAGGHERVPGRRRRSRPLRRRHPARQGATPELVAFGLRDASCARRP